MKVRLAFAVAAHLEPVLLLIDEVLAVGDADFQNKCLGKMDEISSQGRTIIFVSHNMDAVQRLCSRVILLKDATIVDDGKPSDVIHNYLNKNQKLKKEKDWTQNSKIPGNQYTSLFSVKIESFKDGNESFFDIRNDILIEIKYLIKSIDLPIFPSFVLFNDKKSTYF